MYLEKRRLINSVIHYYTTIENQVLKLSDAFINVMNIF